MSTNKELPTVNFDSFPGYDEFSFLHSTYSSEFKNRSLIGSRWGIVDSGYDPASAPFTSGRPLLVSVSPVNPLTIDITSGFAITQSHLLINVDASVPSVTLPDIASGNTYVVAVEYVLVPSPQPRINRYGELTEVRLERPANIPPGGGASTLMNAITVVNINDYYDESLFTEERKQNVVVVAVVAVQSDVVTGQLSLSVDLTRTSYTFNRPWFTLIDIEHRSQIGSGLITTNNPHGMDLQDMSSAGLTLYQQLKPRGGILAKDVTYYGYAGKLCTELIESSRWEVDLRGLATTPLGQQPVGGRYFVKLSKLPVRVGSLYAIGTPWEPIPYEWVPGTRTIVLGTLENPASYPASLIMEYFTVDALEINAEPVQGIQTIEVKSPASTQEFIISGGLAVSSLIQTSISLPSVLGPIKKGYNLICDGIGALALNPQPIVASMKISDLVGTSQVVNQSPLNGVATYLSIGLTGASDSTVINASTYSLDLRLTLTGLNAEGSTVQENIIFKASQWKDQTTLDVEEPLQYQRTVNKFQLLSSVALANTLNEPHNAGPNALISVWSDVFDSSANQEFAPIASFFWTGTSGKNVRDERRIATSFDKLDQKQTRFPYEMPDANIGAVQELLSVLLTPPLTNPETPVKRLLLELDDDRHYSETWKEFSTTGASGSIGLTSILYPSVGQTIRVAPNKVIRIIPRYVSDEVVAETDVTKTTRVALASLGEVQFDPIIDVFRNNLITTINDPTWDSTWFAVNGSGSNPPVLLSRAEAYPEGFLTNVRKKVTFPINTSLIPPRAYPVISGDIISFTLNGVNFDIPYQAGAATPTDRSDETLKKVCELVNSDPLATGGIFASIHVGWVTNQSSMAEVHPFSILMFHGNAEGDDFDLSEVVVSSLTLSPEIVASTSSTDFSFIQPSGGKLPTPHLPQRYPSALTPWTYLSRAILWDGVTLEATIEVLGNNQTAIDDLDAIDVAALKTIRARAGAGAAANPSVGEFLVDPNSLFNTFTNLVNAVNNPTFNTGIFAEIPVSARGVASALAGDTILIDPSARFTPDLVGHFFVVEGKYIGSARPMVLRIDAVDLPTQVVTVTPDVSDQNVQAYVQIINGVVYSFTSDITPTASEVVTGLKADMAADPAWSSSAVNVSGTTALIITAKIAGTAFTHAESANLSAVLTTPNAISTTELTFDPTFITSSITKNLADVPYAIFAPKVRLRSGGMAASYLKLVTESTTGTWLLTNIDGASKYLPKGLGGCNAFLKAVKTVDLAEWRYVTVENQDSGWSRWDTLRRISNTGFTLAAPLGESLYKIQLRLRSKETNAFALYSYFPEVSGATLESLQTRVSTIEGDFSTVLPATVENTAAILELNASMQSSLMSVIYAPDALSLKERCDILDSRLYIAAGVPKDPVASFTPQTLANEMYAGITPQLLSGPADGDFISSSGTTLQVGSVSESNPLLAQLGGYIYRYSRLISLNFATLNGGGAVANGTYYIYLQKATDWGFQISSGTLSLVAAEDTTISGSFPVGLDGVQEGHLFYTESITVGGQPLVMVVTSVSSTELTLAGKIPEDAASVAYKIYAPREGSIGYSLTKSYADKTKLYLGQVTWNSPTFSSPKIAYRYLDKYSSVTTAGFVNASLGSMEITFNHNLGKIPSAFTLYFYEQIGGVPSGEVKVLAIGDEVVVKVTETTLTVRNRYSGLVSRTYDGTAKDRGYIQLVI